MPVLDTIERIIERTTTYDAPSLSLFCTPADPFEIDDPCPHNAGAPHQFTFACGELACVNCARVAWA